MAVTVAAGVLVVVGSAVPARADGELSVTSRGYSCSPTEAGRRTGTWHVASAVAAAGTVTAVSVSDGTASGAGPGDPVGPDGGVSVQFSTGAGPGSVTLSLSVHWDDTGSGSPADASVQDTIALNPCQPRPAVTFTQDCSGQVRVGLSNGSLAAHDAGGVAVFTVTGTGGYRRDNVSVGAGSGATVVVPAAGAAHLQVSANGVPVASGSAPYPGCAVPSRSRSPSASATAGAPSPTPSASSRYDSAGLAGTVAVPSGYPLPAPAVRAAARDSAGRPFAILAGVLAAIGAITGAARWLTTGRRRPAAADPTDVSP